MNEKQCFIIKMAEYAYEQELQRQKNIYEQSQRLLTIQTILVGIMSFVTPLLTSNVDNSMPIINNKQYFVITLALLVISLITNLLSQWGYKHKSFPDPNYLEGTIDDYLKNYQLDYDMNVEYISLKTIWQQMIDSLNKVNDRHATAVLVSMIFLVLTLIAVVVFSCGLL